MPLRHPGRGFGHGNSVWLWLTSGLARFELTPEAHMLGFGIETFRPKVIRRFCLSAFLDNVLVVELLEVTDGLLCDRWPD